MHPHSRKTRSRIKILQTHNQQMSHIFPLRVCRKNKSRRRSHYIPLLHQELSLIPSPPKGEGVVLQENLQNRFLVNREMNDKPQFQGPPAGNSGSAYKQMPRSFRKQKIKAQAQIAVVKNGGKNAISYPAYPSFLGVGGANKSQIIMGWSKA